MSALSNCVRLTIGPLVLAMLAMVGLAEASPAQGEDEGFVLDPPAIIDSLRHGDFQDLKDLFMRYQNEYAAGRISELELQRAYWVFRNSDPALEPMFDRWAVETPTSFVPWLARARRYHTVAWHRRTAKLAGELSDEQVEEVRALFGRAADDYREALARDPRLSIAHAGLVDIAMAGGGVPILQMLMAYFGISRQPSSVEVAMRQGLAANPESIAIRYNYLTSLLPWWNARGGNRHRSYADIVDFVAEIERDVARYPRLQPLLGYADFAVGAMQSWNGEHESAVGSFDSAIAIGELGAYYYYRALSKHRLGQYEAALSDFSRALENNPATARVLSARAQSFYRMDRADLTAADLDAALVLDPFDPQVLWRRAALYLSVNNVRDAEQPFERLAAHGMYDYELRATRGEFFLRMAIKAEESIDDLRAATTMRPRKAVNWYYLALALFTVAPNRAADGDCTVAVAMVGEADAALDRFDALCWRDWECTGDHKFAASETKRFAKDNGARVFCSAG